MSGIPTIGDVVREWRRYRQIPLTEFSKRTKRSKGYISELEHNKIDNPKLDKLKIMAAALGITVRDIVSRRMPGEVKDGNVASEEDMEELQLVGVKDCQALGEEELLRHQLRRRRSGALSSPPIEEPPPVEDSVEATTGQEIDETLEDLSQEERDTLRDILVPHVRQLVRLAKLNRRGCK
jgi:transcriptional regulator with XRE-family HTH domain